MCYAGVSLVTQSLCLEFTSGTCWRVLLPRATPSMMFAPSSAHTHTQVAKAGGAAGMQRFEAADEQGPKIYMGATLWASYIESQFEVSCRGTRRAISAVRLYSSSTCAALQ